MTPNELLYRRLNHKGYGGTVVAMLGRKVITWGHNRRMAEIKAKREMARIYGAHHNEYMVSLRYIAVPVLF